MFEELDMVELTEDVSPRLRKGAHGTIVIVYDCAPREYEVEFFDEEHNTIGLETIPERQLRKRIVGNHRPV
jgi:hypothetical protein